MLTVNDGDIIWVELMENGERLVFEANTKKPGELEEARLLGGLPFGTDIFIRAGTLREGFVVRSLGGQELEGQQVQVLKLTKKGRSGGMTRFRGFAAAFVKAWQVYISTEDAFVRRMEIIGQDGTVVTVSFANQTFNPEVDGSVFAYSPPENVKVMDVNETMTSVSKQQ